MLLKDLYKIINNDDTVWVYNDLCILCVISGAVFKECFDPNYKINRIRTFNNCGLNGKVIDVFIKEGLLALFYIM